MNGIFIILFLSDTFLYYFEPTAMCVTQNVKLYPLTTTVGDNLFAKVLTLITPIKKTIFLNKNTTEMI